MHRMRGFPRLLVLTVLMFFQIQAAAGLWLPCKHAGAGAPDVPCHLSTTADKGAETPGSQLLSDCAKCRLTAAVGALQIASPTNAGRAAPLRPSLYSHPPAHYYRFFPDRANRPPIHHVI